MKKYFLHLLILLFFASCKQNSKPQQQAQAKPTVDSLAILNDPKNNLNIQTNTFTEIDSSGILMFPLSMRETEQESEGSFSYKKVPGSGYWNIIFYNAKTTEYHLLTDKKMIIANYEHKYGNDGQVNIAQKTDYIFYTIRTDDFNKDQKLTYQDPQYLFISDKLGKNFRQISPANYDLNNWKFIKNANKIVLTARKDSDENNKFDDADEVMAFEIALDQTTPQAIFPDNFKNKLKILFDRDWKRLK
jgi:hypothetical protein